MEQSIKSKGFEHRLLLIMWGLLLSLSAFAQQITVKGHVVDATGEPVIGASVIEGKSTNGTITDIDGNFSLNVSANSTLTISFVGYKTQTVSVNGKTALKVTLQEDTEVLDEVVVVGYGTMKKSDLTGAVSSVGVKDIKDSPVANIGQAMQGKVSGVQIIDAGKPGDNVTIKIRGLGTINNSNPLIVIDGIPTDLGLSSLNMADVERVDVLKDASATAIYGSRASNGVIVITTKKGSDSNLRFNYSTNLSVSTITEKLDVLSAYEFREFVPTVSGVPGSVTLGTASTDWQDEIYRTAFGQEHNFSVSGKVKKNAPYRLSVGYNNQNGVVKTNNYERFTFNGGISPKFFDNHLTVDLNVKVSYEDNQKVDESVVNNALRYDPTRPVMTGSATGADEPGLGYFIWMNGNSPMAIQTDNPVAQLELQDLHNKVTRSIGNAAINYKVHRLEDLQLNANLGYDVLKSKYTKNVPDMAGMMYTSNMKDGTGLVYDSKQNKRNYLLDLYANYAHVFNEKHNFSAMAGYGWQHFWKKFDATTLSPEGKELFSPNHYESEYYLLSFYGRLNYSYDNRYMITATLRSDASSRFAKDNRWGLFPSVALGWKISQEAFLRDSEVLSDLKLRLSYGQTGQQDILNDYPYMTTFTVSYPESCYQFGDKWYYTYRPNGYDSDIKWETTETYNIGLDYGFLNNRIYGSVDYYQRHTKDLLNTINVISGTNYSSVITTNIGEMDNKGVEFAINAVPVHTKNWKWTVGMNYTWNDSEITKLNVIDSDANFVQTGAISGTGKTVQVFMVGQRPYTFYLAKQAYDDDGKPMEGQYVQPDGSISATETKYATDKSALPTSYLGFNTQLTYKNWDFAISGHGAFGNYVYNYVAADQYVQSVYSDQGNFSNILRRTKDSGFQNQQLYSDYFLEKGNFFRIDNISLGYTFQKLWNNSSSLRLTFGVQNVATFTSYSGIDPEIYSGIDKEVYPRPRVFSLSANLNF